MFVSHAKSHTAHPAHPPTPSINDGDRPHEIRISRQIPHQQYYAMHTPAFSSPGSQDNQVNEAWTTIGQMYFLLHKLCFSTTTRHEGYTERHAYVQGGTSHSIA
jgi:hypothetical protein